MIKEMKTLKRRLDYAINPDIFEVDGEEEFVKSF